MNWLRYLVLRRAVKKGLIRVVILRENNTIEEFFAVPEEAILRNGFRFLEPRAIYVPEKGELKVTVGKDGETVTLRLDSSALFVDRFKIPVVVYYGRDAIPLTTIRREIEFPRLDTEYLERVVLRAAKLKTRKMEKLLKLILIGIIGIAGLVLLMGGGVG